MCEKKRSYSTVDHPDNELMVASRSEIQRYLILLSEKHLKTAQVTNIKQAEGCCRVSIQECDSKLKLCIDDLTFNCKIRSFY
jgi:hypothetical protein